MFKVKIQTNSFISYLWVSTDKLCMILLIETNWILLYVLKTHKDKLLICEDNKDIY